MVKVNFCVFVYGPNAEQTKKGYTFQKMKLFKNVNNTSCYSRIGIIEEALKTF